MSKAKKLTESFNATIDKLIDEIESEKVSKELEAYAIQAGKFTQYSLRNQILIMVQDPKATNVAGYKTWIKSFGRQVQKGEHGIGILAPHQYTSTDEKGTTEDHIGFHATTVFDVRQTDGEPLVDPSHVDGDDGEQLYDNLAEFSASLGMNAKLVDDMGIVDGRCTKTEILINASLSMQNRIGVIVHELAHHLLGHIGSDKSKGLKEWEAETTSFIFCERFKIENKAPQYLKMWGATRDNIKTSLGTISKVSSRIIKAIEANHQ